MTTAPPTRVVVADDSGLMRRVLTHALTDAGFDVVGQAKDGDEALELCRRLRPDTMTLDLHMPGMDGIGVLRELKRPGAPSIPVIVVSAFSPAHGARAVDALSEGAFDLVAKPGASDALSTFVAELSEKVRAAAGSLRRRIARPATVAAPAPASAPVSPGRAGPISRAAAAAVGAKPLVFIASSTGGPAALARLVPQLPERLGAGTVIVQHMPAGFTASLAARLDKASRLNVIEAKAGDALAPDTVLLGPGGLHLRLDAERRAVLSDDAPIGGLRPRADLAIEDAAKLFGRRLLLVVLTGMGNDGVAGARAVRAHGGRVLIQEESTCTVYGMPRAVAEAGLADAVFGLDELPAAIAREVGPPLSTLAEGARSPGGGTPWA
jgi:two-component system, chemotaxis family, protein-glutamate methylesterase/glutaminase